MRSSPFRSMTSWSCAARRQPTVRGSSSVRYRSTLKTMAGCLAPGHVRWWRFSSAVHPRVVRLQDAARVRLPDPRVQCVEGRDPVSVRAVREVERAPEERGRVRMARSVPDVTKDDVLERDEAHTAARLWLIDKGLRTRRIEHGVADEAAVDVVDTHPAGGRLDARDAGRVWELPIAHRLSLLEVVEAGRRRLGTVECSRGDCEPDHDERDNDKQS